MLGQEVQKLSNPISLDLSKIAKVMYLVELEQQGTTSIQKITIQ